MNIENVVRHMRILWRTERIIADIHLRHLLSAMLLRTIAVLIGFFGILLFELTAYFALAQSWNVIYASAALGTINVVAAGILVLVARRKPSGRDLAIATEVHQETIESLALEARAIPTNLLSLFKHPVAGLLGGLLPLVPVLIKTIAKSDPKGAR